MELFANLGIDPKLLIAQIINFVLLLFILKVLVYTPLVKKIEEDETTLKKAEQIKEELEKEKQQFLLQKQQQEQEIKMHSDKIINEAMQIAETIKQKAQQETEEERQEVLKQIKSRLSNLSYGSESK